MAARPHASCCCCSHLFSAPFPARGLGRKLRSPPPLGRLRGSDAARFEDFSRPRAAAAFAGAASPRSGLGVWLRPRDRGTDFERRSSFVGRAEGPAMPALGVELRPRCAEDDRVPGEDDGGVESAAFPALPRPRSFGREKTFCLASGRESGKSGVVVGLSGREGGSPLGVFGEFGEPPRLKRPTKFNRRRFGVCVSSVVVIARDTETRPGGEKDRFSAVSKEDGCGS